MKITTWICLVCCIAFTGSALAFNSQITAGIDRWTSTEEYDEDSGFSSEGDYSGNEIFASYTYFLSPVEDKGQPLDLLPFFYSRSSYVYGNFYTGGYDFDDNESDYSSEKDWTGLGAGGLFYLTPDTGVGASFFTQEGDWEDNDAVADDTYDEDRDGLSIWVRHYLNENNRVSITYRKIDRERDYANGLERSDDYRWLILSYGGVLGQQFSVYLGGAFGQGSRERKQSNGFEQEHDLTRYSITAGPVYRHFAIYFSWDYYEWDPKGDTWEAEETRLAVSPNYWFSEQLMLGGELYYWKWKDWIDDSYDYEENGLGTEVYVRYRF